MPFTFEIEDPLSGASTGAIEVVVRLAGSAAPRWCFFMTPEALRACGDTLADHPDVRLHIGVPHMLIVSAIDANVIAAVLRELDAHGELLEHTAPVDEE